MTRLSTLIIALLLPTLICTGKGDAGNVIPEPAMLVQGKGSLRISGAVFKCDTSIDSVSMEAIRRFAARLSLVSGRTSSVSTPVGLKSVVDDGSVKGVVFLRDNSIAGEGYAISIGQKSAVIKASDTAGFLNALQTVRQLLPPQIYGERLDEKQKWALPRCEISDAPKNPVRGLELDSCAEFWSVEQVISCLDEMAKYKFNRLVWNLADRQGWRMEVSTCPLLGQRAGYRMEGDTLYGGYYSREDLAKVVRHAQLLGISIVPRLSIGSGIIGMMETSGMSTEALIGEIVKAAANIFPCKYEDIRCDAPVQLGEILEANGRALAGKEAGPFESISPKSEDLQKIGILAEKLW